MPSRLTDREDKPIVRDLEQLARSLSSGSSDQRLVLRAAEMLHRTTRALELASAYITTTEAMRKNLNRRMDDLSRTPMVGDTPDSTTKGGEGEHVLRWEKKG